MPTVQVVRRLSVLVVIASALASCPARAVLPPPVPPPTPAQHRTVGYQLETTYQALCNDCALVELLDKLRHDRKTFIPRDLWNETALPLSRPVLLLAGAEPERLFTRAFSASDTAAFRTATLDSFFVTGADPTVDIPGLWEVFPPVRPKPGYNYFVRRHRCTDAAVSSVEANVRLPIGEIQGSVKHDGSQESYVSIIDGPFNSALYLALNGQAGPAWQTFACSAVWKYYEANPLALAQKPLYITGFQGTVFARMLRRETRSEGVVEGHAGIHFPLFGIDGKLREDATNQVTDELQSLSVAVARSGQAQSPLMNYAPLPSPAQLNSIIRKALPLRILDAPTAWESGAQPYQVRASVTGFYHGDDLSNWDVGVHPDAASSVTMKVSSVVADTSYHGEDGRAIVTLEMSPASTLFTTPSNGIYSFGYDLRYGNEVMVDDAGHNSTLVLPQTVRVNLHKKLNIVPPDIPSVPKLTVSGETTTMVWTQALTIDGVDGIDAGSGMKLVLIPGTSSRPDLSYAIGSPAPIGKDASANVTITATVKTSEYEWPSTGDLGPAESLSLECDMVLARNSMLLTLFLSNQAKRVVELKLRVPKRK